MDGARFGLLGLVLVCVCIALVLVAASSAKEKDARKNIQSKAPAKDASESQPKLDALSASPKREKALEEHELVLVNQSRLGIPPPGEKRVEAVAPRTVGRARL